MRRIFLDIETIPGPVKPDPSEVEAPANYKDPEKIRAYQEAGVDKAWRGQALDSLKGSIICIGFAEDDGPTRAFVGDESDVMEKFAAFCRPSMTLPEIIGFNLRQFDILWLRHRAYRYGLNDLATSLPWQRYDKRVLDLREVWTGGDPRGRGTLDEICKFVGLGGKSGSGSQVFEMWQAGRLDDIAEYCRDDVRLTRELWKTMFPREATMLGGYRSEVEFI